MKFSKNIANTKHSSDFHWLEILHLIQEGLFAIQENGEIYCNQVFKDLLMLPDNPVPLSVIIAKLGASPDRASAELLIEKVSKRQTGVIAIRVVTASDKEKIINVTLTRTSDNKTLVGLTSPVSPPTDGPGSDLDGLLHSVFEAVEDGIFILEPGTLLIKRVNQAACRILGLSIDELLHKSILGMMAKQSRVNEISAMIASKLPILKSVHIDLEMTRSNGTTFPALHGITEITSSEKEVIAWMWIVTEMTQRVFINRALIDLETRYRLLFDRTADPTLIIDAVSRKIIDANAAAEAQLLYSRSELIGLNMDDITPKSRRGEMQRDFESLGIGESSTIEGLNLTKTGEEIPVQISAVATDFEGRKVFIASCRDVSQQKFLELERLRLEKLDTVRKVAGGLAHEFSQPLQGLTTIVDLLGRPGLSAETREELLKKIEPSVLRMVALLEQMKKIVRVETKPYAGSDDIVDIEHSVE